MYGKEGVLRVGSDQFEILKWSTFEYVPKEETHCCLLGGLW